MKKHLFILLFTIPIAEAAPKLTFPQYEALVEKHAALQGLDKNLIWAVMGRESSGNPNALSKKNARGLMQVIPPTAARMGVDPKNLYHPESNLVAGTRYLRFLCNRFPDKNHPTGCNIDFVLAGYNAGEGRIYQYRGIPPFKETREYVQNVKMRYARLSGKPVYAANEIVKPVQAAYQAPVSASLVSAPAQEPNTPKTVQVVAQRKYESWDVFQEF